ncbi:DegQ family serine endoprotease [Jiella endophytica]|uniref:DegQ family serine endoprotease n=1 Tax=Jiella endophytica TaxID=2558362 RepID=A0A4Y8RV60_9HYPH|nr:DegQ family serine endoprotease [Jiella endophytica]TFF27421.1 DegQ family serine endoprotease [Jiella endophytica]
MKLKLLALAAVLFGGTAFAVPAVINENAPLHHLLAPLVPQEPVRLTPGDDSLREGLGLDDEPRWQASDAPAPTLVAAQGSETGASAQSRVPQSQAEIKLSFAPLVKATAPAVVNVYAARQVSSRRSPFADDPFFGQFFGNRFDSPPRMEQSLGSGVIVDKSGLVVTNNHVVQGADEVKIAFADGREFETKVLSKDATVDLAVLKIEGGDGPFPIIPIADSDDLQTGDLVLAIGNPFGIGQTVTNGIVSALARNHIGVNDFGFFIQTDAAINPGNSGGALIDMSGQLVGVNSAIYSRSGGSNGIGFAIPSNMVATFVRAAKNGGRFERPFVGADFAPVTPDIAEALGLDRPSGALVRSIYPNGPAEKAGLKVGDVVMKAEGREIATPDALDYRFATLGIGKTVKLDVLSSDETEHLSLALEQAPEKPARDARDISGRNPFAGATVYNLSPRVAGEFRLPQDKTGVVVAKVAPRSLAARFGLEAGDIVLEVNGESVDSTKTLDAIAGENYRGWQFDIERDGRRLTQVVR